MRVALLFIMAAVIAAALALLLGARALRRRAIAKAERAAEWEESVYAAVDGMRVVVIRRVATLHDQSWHVEPEKVVARIPRCRDQTSRVTDALGDAYLLALDKNARLQ